MKLRAIGVVALLVTIGAGPTSRKSATQPEQESTQVTLLKSHVADAVEKAISRWHLTPEYVAEKKRADELGKVLEAARANGSPEAKLAASHDFVASDQKIKKMQSVVIGADPQIKAATVALNEELKSLADEKAATAKKTADDALAAKRATESDPKFQAAQAGQIILGMTESQAEQAFTNRKERNVRRRGGGGTISMRVSDAVSIPGAGPRDVIHQSTSELGDGLREIKFTRSLQYMNGSEYPIDEVTVTFQNGKVSRVFDQ